MAAIERRNRTSEAASLVRLDIEHFKEIYDAFGHAAGDDVLRRLVALIGCRMRSVDILFRTGGEEFALLLSGARYADAMLVAEELRLLVADATLTDIGGRISISAGVCEAAESQSAYAGSRMPTRRCIAPSAPAATASPAGRLASASVPALSTCRFLEQ
jgi:diguanylate cyclase (GGDEF)-like protein